MGLIKPILGTAVGLGSLALVKHSAKLLKDNLKSPKIQGKNLVKGAVNLTLGTVLLSSTSKIIGDLE